MNATVLWATHRGTASASLPDTLNAQGFQVVPVNAPSPVVTAIRTYRPDIVLVDLTLPGHTAHDLCREVKIHDQLPVVFIAAAADETDEVVAFAVGADDYIVWPAPPRAVAARLQAAVRRSAPRSDRPPIDILEHDGIVVEKNARQVLVNGVEITLTRTEFELLTFLMEHPSRVIRRHEIVTRTWGQWPGDHHVLEVHLSRLRAKILKADGPHIAEAVRGVGYRLASSRGGHRGPALRLAGGAARTG